MMKLILFLSALLQGFISFLSNMGEMGAVTTARKVQGYSDISEAALGQVSIIRAVANLDIERHPATGQMNVYVHELAAIADYVPGTGVALSADSSAYVNLNNLKEKAVNELLDGYTVESAPMDFAQKRFEAGVLKIGEQIDTDALTALEAGGTEFVAAGGAKPTSATIYSDILNLKKELDDAKAPRTNRSLIVTPEMEALLLNTDSKVYLNTERGLGIMQEGFVGRIAGFDVYSTVLLPSGTNMIAMQQRGFAYGDFYTVGAKIQSLDASGTYIGDSAVQARMAYNYGAIRATLIQVNNGAA